MTNHYHLLLQTPEGNLSQIMRHINGAYTTYFNVKRKHAGLLFQGRYKAILVEADSYATELSRYMHLNPVRAKIVELPEEYIWSSYQHYIGTTAIPAWLNINFILRYCGNKEDARTRYEPFVEERIGKTYESPLKDTVAGTILGSTSFIETIQQTHIPKYLQENGIPALPQIKPRPSVDEIMPSARVLLVDNEKLACQMGIYLCHKHSGMKLKEIGEKFNMRESAICEASRHIKDKAVQDGALRKQIETI
jgi:putative transposase